MFFFRQFQEFNPLSGDVYESPFSGLPAIAERARDLVRTRTPEQILIIAECMGYFIDSHFSDLEFIAIDELKNKSISDAENPNLLDSRSLEMFFDYNGGDWDDPDSRPLKDRFDFKKDMIDQLGILTAENSSVVDALKARLEDWDDEEPEEDPNERKEGKNYEFFAVLALVLVANAQKWYFEYKSTSLAGESAIQAMDAVCHAEHLQRKAVFKSCLLSYKASEEKNIHTQRQSERGKKGAANRHAANNKLKAWVIDLYQKEESKREKRRSANEVAHDLKERVLQHGKTIEANLSEANAQRTIAEWINQHLARLAATPTR